MEAYDRRQIEVMRDQLRAYRQGKIDLPWLISSLEALRNTLQSVPMSWLDLFMKDWGTLEELYSIGVVRETGLSPSSEEEVRGAVASLTLLVESLLSTTATEGEE